MYSSCNQSYSEILEIVNNIQTCKYTASQLIDKLNTLKETVVSTPEERKSLEYKIAIVNSSLAAYNKNCNLFNAQLDGIF